VRAGRLAAELPGPGHLGIGCDLLDRGQVERLFDRVARTYGHLDVLVNNVGMTCSERFDERSVELELNLNLLSPLIATRLAIPLLRAAHDLRVITTVSLGGIFPLGETPIYTASKFGLRATRTTTTPTAAPAASVDVAGARRHCRYVAAAVAVAAAAGVHRVAVVDEHLQAGRVGERDGVVVAVGVARSSAAGRSGP
jgi:short-subunit dehydrogenase involved in D-alanine esterification of teichoic acids